LSATSHRYLAALLLVLAGVGLGACRQDTEGPQRLARAEARYAELVTQGVPVRDPAYDAVITELEAVPQDSRARPEAQRRLEALHALRSPLPPRPLGRPGEDGGEHGHAHEDGGT
jgi:hypothetical protein